MPNPELLNISTNIVEPRLAIRETYCVKYNCVNGSRSHLGSDMADNIRRSSRLAGHPPLDYPSPPPFRRRRNPDPPPPGMVPRGRRRNLDPPPPGMVPRGLAGEAVHPMRNYRRRWKSGVLTAVPGVEISDVDDVDDLGNDDDDLDLGTVDANELSDAKPDVGERPQDHGQGDDLGTADVELGDATLDVQDDESW